MALQEHLLSDFATLADVSPSADQLVYHGSSAFFEEYDFNRAKKNGGAVLGLGQYFMTGDNAYEKSKKAAYLAFDTPINSEEEIRGKIYDKKVLYEGTVPKEELKHIIIPEKMTDKNYDSLIQYAQKNGKTDIAQQLTEIKNVKNYRSSDLCRWLREKEHIDFMLDAGISGVYDEKTKFLCSYNSSKKYNLKIKEAKILNGSEIPTNLLTKDSRIFVQDKIQKNFMDVINVETLSGKDLLHQASSSSPTVKVHVKDFLDIKNVNSRIKSINKAGLASVSAPALITGSALAYTYYQQTGDFWASAEILGKSVKMPVIQGAAMHAGIWGVTKTAETVTTKVVEKQVSKTAGTMAAKVIAKKAGEDVAKSIVKKVPGISVAAGTYFAYKRLEQGAYFKAFGEFASGLLACIPFYGTAASTAIDCSLAASDVYDVINEDTEQQSNKEMRAAFSQAMIKAMEQRYNDTTNEEMRAALLQAMINIACPISDMSYQEMSDTFSQAMGKTTEQPQFYDTTSQKNIVLRATLPQATRDVMEQQSNDMASLENMGGLRTTLQAMSKTTEQPQSNDTTSQENVGLRSALQAMSQTTEQSPSNDEDDNSQANIQARLAYSRKLQIR